MDENLNSRHKEIFLRLLTNPADTGGVYLVNLQELVKAYPQSGLLRAMYGRALNESTPIVAGGYFDNRALHKLLYHHDSLLPVNPDQLILKGDTKLNGYTAITQTVAATIPAAVHENVVAVTESSHIFTDQPTNIPDVLTVHEPESQVKETVYTKPEPESDVDEIVHIAPGPQSHIAEVIHTLPPPEITPLIEEPVAETQKQSIVEEEPLGRASWETDEEEEETVPPVAETEPEYTHYTQEPVYEQISEEIIPEPVIEETAPVPEPVAPQLAERSPWEQIAEEYAALTAQNNGQAIHHTPIEPVIAKAPQAPFVEEPEAVDEVDELVNHNIAATNYFALDNSFVEHKNGSDIKSAQEQDGLQVKQSEHQQNGAHHQDVSKYHDEKMPYSFMWWLDKTRKEHDATYQPYANTPGNNQNNKPGKSDGLQQQYFENIFHMSSVDTLVNPAEPQTVAFDMQNKDDRIIKRFITEDPHIHPPLGEKLDTENKAKRSSEDEYEMVTETLARIYADQMLFPKAIATYRKLMLKFPEKSRYFASRIDALEKRTN